MTWNKYSKLKVYRSTADLIDEKIETLEKHGEEIPEELIQARDKMDKLALELDFEL